MLIFSSLVFESYAIQIQPKNIDDNVIYIIDKSKYIKYFGDSKNVYSYENNIKKSKINIDRISEIHKIVNEIIIIEDVVGKYPNPPIFHRVLPNGELKTSHYKYTEMPELFSYHDGFSCIYSSKDNISIKFSCSNPDISKTAKYSYEYKNGIVKLMQVTSAQNIKSNICSNSYQNFVEKWNISKENNIYNTEDNMSNAVTAGLEQALNITWQQYASLLNSKKLISKAEFSKKYCKK